MNFDHFRPHLKAPFKYIRDNNVYLNALRLNKNEYDAP